jgi:hypothetical protein
MHTYTNGRNEDRNFHFRRTKKLEEFFDSRKRARVGVRQANSELAVGCRCRDPAWEEGVITEPRQGLELSQKPPEPYEFLE